MATVEAQILLCTACNQPSTQLCSRCKGGHYCSKDCQKSDWPTHKLLCAAFASFDMSSRPSGEHSLAFLFPVDENKPQIIWLPCEQRLWGQAADLGFIFGTDASERMVPIQYNKILKRALTNTLYISYRDNFLHDGSKPNKSVSNLTATKTGRYHDWRGPIVAYGMKGLGSDQKECRDINMDDFRHIADYFFWYMYQAAPDPHPKSHPHDSKVQGVRINCQGDQQMFKRPRYEAVQVPASDAIFSEHTTSDIADRIELPIWTRQCIPNPKWADDANCEIGHPFVNQSATFLHICCDPHAKCNTNTGSLGFGMAALQWQIGVGSVIVIRRDKKPLSPVHVEALCDYCRYEMGPYFSHAMGEYAPETPMSKDFVLSMIRRSTFVVWWYKMLDQRSEKGEIITAPLPYDV